MKNQDESYLELLKYLMDHGFSKQDAERIIEKGTKSLAEMMGLE